jgi:hypothetical protein
MTSGSPSNRKLERMEYRSLGLNYLLSILPPDQEISILDLGPALDANVSFWAGFRCRLAIADFYRDYGEAVAANPEAARSDLFAAILAFCDAQTFDLRLGWDLLHYLEPEDVDLLLRVLRLRCRPGSFLFAMLSSQPSIPALPMIFRILDRDRMVHEARGGEERPCPRLQPRDLARMLPEFDISGSYLLRHGLQEYVLCHRGDGASK